MNFSPMHTWRERKLRERDRERERDRGRFETWETNREARDLEGAPIKKKWNKKSNYGCAVISKALFLWIVI